MSSSLKLRNPTRGISMNDLMLFLHFLEGAMYQKVDPSKPPVRTASQEMLQMGTDPIDLVNLLRGFAADLIRSADEVLESHSAR